MLTTNQPSEGTIFTPAFSSGELSPAVAVRPDMDKWLRGAGLIKNFIVRPEGGLIKAPGTNLIEEILYPSQKGRFIPFTYSSTQGIGIFLQDHTAVFYKDGGKLVYDISDLDAWSDASVDYALDDVVSYNSLIYRCAIAHTSSSTYYPGSGLIDDPWIQDDSVFVTMPYSKDELQDLDYVGSGDTIMFYHDDHAPYKLTRYADDNWTVEQQEFDNHPQLKQNTDAGNKMTITSEVQVGLPSSDTSAGSWAASSGSDLYAMINNITNTSTYIYVTSSSTCQIALNSLDTPVSRYGHVLKVKYADYGGSECDLGVALYCGSTEIYSFQVRGEDASNEVETVIPASIAALITDYTDLSLKFNRYTSGSARVYWAVLYIPVADGGSGSTISGIGVGKDSIVSIEFEKETLDSGHVGSIFALQYTAQNHGYDYHNPLRGSHEGPIWAVRGDWDLYLNPYSTSLVDEVNLYLQKSVDEGASWNTVQTIAASDSSSDREFTGSEDDFCYMRIIRKEDPSDNDGAAISFTSSGADEYVYFKILTVTDSTHATAELLSDFFDPGDNGSFMYWSEGAWSDYRGWPRATCFAKGRQFMAGSDYKRTQVWGTKPDDFINFDQEIPVEDDDGINYPINSRRGEIINFLVPLRNLLALTTDSEWAISPGSEAGAFSPTDVQTDVQGYRGCERIKPIEVGESAIFVQRGGRTVRALNYTLQNDGYTGSNLSIFVKHLFKNGYTMGNMAYQQEPYSVVWGVRSDGLLLGLTLEPEQNIFAWFRRQLGYDGLSVEVEDVCCVPNSDGDDVVYLLVKRTWDSGSSKYIEYFKRNDDDFMANGGIYLDCSISGTLSTPGTAITGLEALEGRTVDVLYRNVDEDEDNDIEAVYYYETDKVVSNGEIAVEKTARWACVGFPYESRLETLPLDISAGSIAKKKKAVRIGAAFENFYSDGIKFGTSDRDLKEPSYPPVDKEKFWETYRMNGLVDAKYGYESKGIISQSEPWPVTILTLSPEVIFDAS